MKIKRSLVPAAVVAAALVTVPAFAEGSPWLPAPGAGTLSVSWASQEATEYYRATLRPTPGPGDELARDTLWVRGTWGLADSLALDFRIGTAESSFPPGPSPPRPPQENLSGLQDVNVGLVWRFRDEVTSSGPSMALRAAAIVAGDYDTGYISSLGDGAEISLVVGKYVGERGALSGEVGYRTRSDSVPEDIFLNLSAGVLVGDRWV